MGYLAHKVALRQCAIAAGIAVLGGDLHPVVGGIHDFVLEFACRERGQCGFVLCPDGAGNDGEHEKSNISHHS